MNLVDFISLVNQKKEENPFWFDDEPDTLAEDRIIAGVETKLGVVLPEKYKSFVKEFGGGYFAFTNIFSVDQDGEWYIVEKNNQARSYLPQNFVAISDDEAGGMYGYVVHEGVCGEGVYYWDHDTGSIGEKMYEDVLDYIVAAGLSN